MFYARRGKVTSLSSMCIVAKDTAVAAWRQQKFDYSARLAYRQHDYLSRALRARRFTRILIIDAGSVYCWYNCIVMFGVSSSKLCLSYGSMYFWSSLIWHLDNTYVKNKRQELNELNSAKVGHFVWYNNRDKNILYNTILIKTLLI